MSNRIYLLGFTSESALEVRDAKPCESCYVYEILDEIETILDINNEFPIAYKDMSFLWFFCLRKQDFHNLYSLIKVSFQDT